MPSLPSLTELGLLGSYTSFVSGSTFEGTPLITAYSPWWTTLAGPPDADDIFHGHKSSTIPSQRPRHARKRRAVSPDDQAKPTLALHIPDSEDVPELEEESASPESSPESSPEPSPQTSPQTSPETAAAELALPRRPLLPLPLPRLASNDITPEERRDTLHTPSETLHTQGTRRNAPRLANLLSPTPHVYCLYKFDRVDQLGGKRRGTRYY